MVISYIECLISGYRARLQAFNGCLDQMTGGLHRLGRHTLTSAWNSELQCTVGRNRRFKVIGFHTATSTNWHNYLNDFSLHTRRSLHSDIQTITPRNHRIHSWPFSYRQIELKWSLIKKKTRLPILCQFCVQNKFTIMTLIYWISRSP